MKNNEIMISTKFEFNNHKTQILSFLVLKDITLSALIEAIYYGLKKSKEYGDCFELFDEYIRTRKELQVLYTSKGSHSIIDFTQKVKDGEESKRIYDMELFKLGFVTSSCILVTLNTEVKNSALFTKVENSYILKEKDSLEYNISTRRLNVIESSVIDIISPNDMPQRDKSTLLDVVIPTVLSTGGMLAARFLIMRLAPGASSMGNTMLLMSGAMGVVSLVTSFYSYMKKRTDYKKNVEEWKTNYENYISRIIKTIKEWQESDIVYLNSVYPNMDTLFNNTSEINNIIFSRSQNDNDFMKISLGTSNEVKPLFEIKSEKKDNIFYDIYYKMRKSNDGIDIIVLSKKADKKLKKLTPEEISEKERNKFLLTDLAYNFANKGVDEKNDEIIGFNYLRSVSGKNPPLLLDLKNCGALGVISNDIQTSHSFIRHIIFELSYYHSPEDIQFVFFFDEEKNLERQNALIEDYRYLPHTNELFDGISQFVFDKESSGIVFGQLLSIMNNRSSNKREDIEDGISDQKQTQVVCVVFYDYDIKETGFSKYLPEVPKEGEPYVNSLGLTFIFIQAVKDMLPKYCGNIVNIDKENEKERKVSLRYNILSRETLNVLSEDKDDKTKANDTDKLIEYKYFRNEYIFDHEKYRDKYALAFKQLSAIYYTRVAENGNVPSMVTLFELYGYNSEKIENGEVRRSIAESWKNTEKNDVTRNLCVPIGKNEHGSMYLDLYEKADGPHKAQDLDEIESRDKRNETLSFRSALGKKFGYNSDTGEYKKHVKKYLTFPKELTNSEYEKLKQIPHTKGHSVIPVSVGLDYVDFYPVTVDLGKSHIIAIYGKKEFGKTNLLKLLLNGLVSQKNNVRLVFFDDGRNQLSCLYDEYKNSRNCVLINKFDKKDLPLKDGTTISRKISPLQQFYIYLNENYIELDKRFLAGIYGVSENLKKEYENIPDCNAVETPFTAFVIQSKLIYLNTPDGKRFINSILPQLSAVAEERGFLFIFTDVQKISDSEQNSFFNNNISTAFLLDNIAEFAGERGQKTIFGNMDVKTLKEDYARCELGDGYFYDVEADKLSKLKFIKY